MNKSKFRVTYFFIYQQMGVICKRARRAPAAGPQEITKDLRAIIKY